MRARCLTLLLPALVAAGLGISGCAAPNRGGAAASADPGTNDPLEETNRAIFNFNERVNHALLIPAAKAYRTVLPPPVQQSVHDFLQNLNEPVVFANDVLQGQPALAANSIGRLAVNTTIGVGGMFDVATRAGIPYHSNGLGTTLANWGFADGPYIMVPVLGPSNVRDLVGQVGDSFADPGDYFAGEYHLIYAAVARSAVAGVDTLSRNIESLADLEKTSLDYYATIRSLYRQRRAAEIRHEQTKLPNPGPMGGADSGAEPAMSYSPARPPGPPGAAPAAPTRSP